MADRELSNALASGELSSIQLGGVTTAEKVLKKSEIDAVYETIVNVDAIDTRVSAVESPTVIPFVPQATPPTYAEGNVFYNSNSGTMDVHGAYNDVTVQIGREQHIEVVNNTGALIPNGAACRHNGVSGGKVQVELAIADSFTNAIILGVATHDIANGATGILTTFGIINDLDTSGATIGVPLYLSDTIAGTYSHTPPDILTQVGGALTNDALTGQIFVSLENNISFPTVLAYMNNGSSATSLGATFVDVNGYLTHGNVFMPYNQTTGEITVPSTGIYTLTVNMALLFDAVGPAEEQITLRILGSISGATDIPVIVGRNGGGASAYPTITFNATAGEVVKLQLACSTTTLTNVTYPLMTFEIESTNVR